MLNVNKNNQGNNSIKQNQLHFSNLKEVDYFVQNYSQFVTLPPQIPIPFNQIFLYSFSITIQRISFLEVLSKSGDPGFLLRSFWWGQNNGYLHRLIEQNQQNQHNDQSKQFQNRQNLKSKTKNQFYPIKFLVCCPLQNFFSYIYDMKVLKLQLLQPQLKKIIAKTYINFSVLKGWQGQKLASTLDITLSNGKRAGEMIVHLQIFKIKNPYNIEKGLINNNSNISNNGLANNITKQNYIDQRQTISKQKKRKQIINNQSFLKRNISNQKMIKDCMLQQSQNQNFEELKDHKQNKDKFKDNDIKNKNNFYNYDLNTYYQNSQNFSKNKYNFQSEMLHLHQDFQLLFCNKNKNIDFSQGKNQKIQFHLRLDQNLLKQKEGESHISNKFNVIFPVLRKIFGKSQVQYNQFHFLDEGIVKIQVNPAKHTQKQLENYLKNSSVQVSLYQDQNNSKDNKKPSFNASHYSNRIPLYRLLSYQGSQVPVILQLNSQKNNVGKKGNQITCFIKVAGQRQISEQVNQQNQNKQIKDHKNQSKLIQNQFVWMKLMQFIPLQLSYFTNSNIFIRIMPRIQQKSSQSSQSIIESRTLWNAFSDFSKSQTKLLPRANFNQMLTFPILKYKQSQNEKSQNNQISLEIWDKQKKTLLVGYGIIDMNQNSNRRQIQIHDTKQTVGYLTIWIQKGDITYVNNLISTHSQHQPNLSRQKSKRTNSKSQLNKLKDDSNLQSSSHKQGSQVLNNNDKTSEQRQDHQQSLNSGSLQGNYNNNNSNNQQINHFEQNNQIKNIIAKRQNQNNLNLKEKTNLQIHNIIYFKFMIFQEANNDKNYHESNELNLQNLENDLSLTQFTQIIKFTFKSTNENGLNNTARMKFNDVNTEQLTLWIEKICSCYGFVDQSSRYLINWRQFYEGFQAYQVYYDNIIQQRDILLGSILQRLQNNGISISQLQSKFTLISKNKIFQKLSQIFSTQIGQKIRFHYPKLKKIQQLCDQLRKFQVYETTNQKYVQTEVLKKHIITQIRQILQLQAYEKDREILTVMKKEGIQLSKWEEMNLNYENLNNNYQKQEQLEKQEESFKRGESAFGKNTQNQNKIINKSPTFGFLQPYNNQASQRQQLINTYPNDNNPSIVNNLPKKETKLNLIESNQNFNDSDTFRKRIQTISPINHVSSSDEGKVEKMKIIFSNVEGIVQWVKIDHHTFYPDIGNKNFVANFEQSSVQNASNLSISYSEFHMQNEQISIFNIKKQFQYQVYICLVGEQIINQSVSQQKSQIMAQKQQILIQCVHGQWQGIIDNEGNYRGCLKIC